MEIQALLNSIRAFLAAGDTASAEEYCARVLEQEPGNAEAYLFRLMIKYGARQETDLENIGIDPYNDDTFLRNDEAYKKVLSCADPELAKKLAGYDSASIYNAAMTLAEQEDEKALYRAAYLFERSGRYKNASEMVSSLRKRADETVYNKALKVINEPASSEQELSEAVKLLERIPYFKDSRVQRNRAIELAEEAFRERTYNEAIAKAGSGDPKLMIEAAKIMDDLSGYKEADTLAREYHTAIEDYYKAKREETERRRRETEERAFIAESSVKEKNELIPHLITLALRVAGIVCGIAILFFLWFYLTQV